MKVNFYSKSYRINYIIKTKIYLFKTNKNHLSQLSTFFMMMCHPVICFILKI